MQIFKRIFMQATQLSLRYFTKLSTDTNWEGSKGLENWSKITGTVRSFILDMVL